MILAPVMHTSKNMIARINDVIRCHTDMVQTVNGLKIQVAVMDTKNKHLQERVRILEENAEMKSVEEKKQDEDNQLVFTNTVAALHKTNSDLTGRVAVLERIEEQRIAQEVIAKEIVKEKIIAAEKIIAEKTFADRCAEVIKKNADWPLHQAANDGESNEVFDHFIFILKFNVNTKAKDGTIPLHYAAMGGHTKTVEHLLIRGADINAKDSKGKTPLQRATGRIDVELLLRSQGGTL